MYKKVSIIGLGLIGGSIAKALKSADDSFYIGAYDKNNIDNALFENVIDKRFSTVEDTLNAEVIFLCLPIDESIDAFKLLAPKLKKDQILTDVCSVKSVFADLWSQLNSDGTYIGGHPMSGKEKGGYSNSDPLLFENSIYILTEDLSKSDQHHDFRKLIELLGAHLLFIPAKQHDVIAASVSHLPQLVSIALVNTAAVEIDQYKFINLAAGGFRDMTRIASSDFNIWRSIISENKGEIITAIEKFSFELERIKQLIDGDNYTDLQSYFESARTSRNAIPLNSKGFLTPLHDIYVFVKDEPGVISKVSTALYEARINIKDIELLKIREGAGGTFRIAFESANDAESASKVLQKVGFRISTPSNG